MNMTPMQAQLSDFESERLAKYHAGLILQSALGEGLGAHPDQVKTYGTAGAEKISDALTDIAVRLENGETV